MRKLQESAAAGDAEADLAIEVFCLSIRKTIAAYAAVMGGLDMIIFAGGIGEHSAEVRRRVGEGLGFVGVKLDSARNQAGQQKISQDSSTIAVCVVASQEDRQIARHCRALRG